MQDLTPTERDVNKASPGPSGGWLRRLPLIVILCTGLTGAILLREELSFAALARHHDALVAFRDAHAGLSVGLFLLSYTAVVALSLPGGLVFSLTAGFLFGVWPGAAYAVAAAGTGAVLVFLAARAGIGTAVHDRLARSHGAVARLSQSLERNEWSVLFLLRLVPAVPFFIANLVPALLGTSLWRFAVSTYLGIIPGAILFTSVGSGLGEILARGEAPDLHVLSNPSIWGPLVGLAVLAALPILVRPLRKGF